MSPAVAVLVALVAGLCSAASVVTGFGFALLAVPPLAALLGARSAVVLVTALGIVTSTALAIRSRELVRWRVARPLFAGSLLGMPLGLLLLLGVRENVLRLVIAVAVVAFTALLTAGVRLPLAGTTGRVAAGAVSGALATSTSTNGPPLVITLQASGLEPAAFRATLSVLFLASGSISLALMAAGGAVTSTALTAWVVALPAVLVGFGTGEWMFRRVDPAVFRRLVIGGLLLSGAMSTVAALG